MFIAHLSALPVYAIGNIIKMSLFAPFPSAQLAGVRANFAYCVLYSGVCVCVCTRAAWQMGVTNILENGGEYYRDCVSIDVVRCVCVCV